jgi:cell division protein FtsW (lipid II flippase)
VAGLLSGWGLLTIWRLFPAFGMRQTVWLLVAGGVIFFGLRIPKLLRFLRSYKYLWLTGGLVLTGLTLFLGTNPLGYGPRMWLGCCGIYMQPSEPLKLLLIIYLAAYLAGDIERPSISLPLISPPNLLPLLAPTLIMTGMAMLLLLAQRDLGTASIFLFLYTAIVYLASARKRVLVTGGAAILIAGIAGYLLFDVVQVRINAWINPWVTPSGEAYQIIQSLLAVANGGLIGRGPGVGSPRLVPVPHSDFIFSSIVEETGLLGGFGILLLIGLMANRGYRIALQASNFYRRFLAAGLTTYLVAQSILIIGGNLRLLPLTGVTLPFVSYGGSSLVTSFFSLLLLLKLSSPEQKPAALLNPRPYLQLDVTMVVGLAAAGLALGWWGLIRAPDLLVRADNPRRAISDRYVVRGAILDRQNNPLNATAGEVGNYTRQFLVPELSPVLGYTNPLYGQSGLEASMDAVLRGLRLNPGLSIWWHHLLYGQPPPGLNIRTSLSIELQKVAEERMQDQKGALVLLKANSGEILSMVSHPTFDANRLDEIWPDLIVDPDSPLLNRATQGLYPPGAVLGPLLYAQAVSQTDVPQLPANAGYTADGQSLSCALNGPAENWNEALSNGCPGAVAALGTSLGSQQLKDFLGKMRFFEAPDLRLPTESGSQPGSADDPAAIALGLTSTANQNSLPADQALRVSPLQMALAAAALSNQGSCPAPLLVTGVETPQSGWVLLDPLSQLVKALPSSAADLVAATLAVEGQSIWQSLAVAPNGPDKYVTWYLAGTLPSWKGDPLTLAVLIEDDDPQSALRIGQDVLEAVMQP